MASCLTLAGRNFSGAGQNAGMAFVKLKDWELRTRPDLKVGAAVVGGPCRRFRRSATRAWLRFRRRRSWSWGRQAGSTSSYRTAADWGTKL